MKKSQGGYKAEPLSAFLGQPTPKAAPAIDWMKPLSVADQKTSLEFFNILSFVLQFCPTVPSEQEMKQAFADGIADAWKKLDRLISTDIAAGRVTSGDVAGTRKYLKNNYLYRFAAAVVGIYALSKEEAVYPIYRVDSKGQSLDASNHRYMLRFELGKLPPANAFWSVTMYDLPASLMVANPINRYLINSPMLPDLKRDADGGLTIYIQQDSPGKDKESNWLPAPNGPFWLAIRIYWPKPEALDGTWKQPPLVAAW